RRRPGLPPSRARGGRVPQAGHVNALSATAGSGLPGFESVTAEATNPGGGLDRLGAFGAGLRLPRGRAETEAEHRHERIARMVECLPAVADDQCRLLALAAGRPCGDRVGQLDHAAEALRIVDPARVHGRLPRVLDRCAEMPALQSLRAL